MRNLIEASIIAPAMSSSSSSSLSQQQHDPSAIVQTSPWHSPVPYLFGGLAAMLGLIAFALLILACSYWKLSSGSDGEAAKGDGEQQEKVARMYEEKIVVIMAGDEKPTYLAMPVCSRGSSFGDQDSCRKNQEMNETEKMEKNKEEEQVVVVIQISEEEEDTSMASSATSTQLPEEHQNS